MREHKKINKGHDYLPAGAASYPETSKIAHKWSRWTAATWHSGSEEYTLAIYYEGKTKTSSQAMSSKEVWCCFLIVSSQRLQGQGSPSRAGRLTLRQSYARPNKARPPDPDRERLRAELFTVDLLTVLLV
jgi:hypothetical protein